MFLQLNPTIAVSTPHGNGVAMIAFHYPQVNNLHWVVYLIDDGKIETYTSNDIAVDTKVISETWLYDDVLNAIKRNQPQLDIPND